MESANSKLRLKEKKGHGLLASLLFSLVFTCIFSLAFLLVAALCTYSTSDPASLIQPLSYVALFLAALIAGLSSGKYYGQRGAFVGFLSGLLFSVVLFFVSLASGQFDTESLPVLLITYLAFSVIAAIGGVIGGKKKEKRRNRRHT